MYFSYKRKVDKLSLEKENYRKQLIYENRFAMSNSIKRTMFRLSNQSRYCPFVLLSRILHIKFIVPKARSPPLSEFESQHKFRKYGGKKND